MKKLLFGTTALALALMAAPAATTVALAQGASAFSPGHQESPANTVAPGQVKGSDENASSYSPGYSMNTAADDGDAGDDGDTGDNGDAGDNGDTGDGGDAGDDGDAGDNGDAGDSEGESGDAGTS